MTNYTGSLNITGTGEVAGLESATFSGSFGVSLSATVDSAGNGSGPETFKGNLRVHATYADGSTNDITVPFNLPTTNVQLKSGAFQVKVPGPDLIPGLQFGVSLSGTVSADQQRITENFYAIASGTYLGMTVSETVTATGTLTAAPPPVSPVSISGSGGTQAISDTSAVAPFRNTNIVDPNAGATDTVRITVSNAANGTLSNLGGGSFNPSTGAFTVSGSAAAVSAAVEGLVFKPTAHQSATGQTVTTSFTISVSDTVGQSANGGTANVATTQTLLGALSVNQQLELIYLAYFNRAADGGGFSFWNGQNVSAQNDGQGAAVALTNIANAFAPQPETIALYSFLGSQNVNLNTPAAQSGLNSFITGVYKNLFGHAADSAGQSYWVGQITGGAVGLGAAALAIANGATGTDATDVQNKIAVALDFTSRTTAAGLGQSSSLPASFVTAAHSVLNGVDGTTLNDASVTAGMNATTAFLSTSATGHATSLTADAAPSPIGDPITISLSNSTIDPGMGSHTIRFLPGAHADTLVPHPNGVEDVFGFDLATDVLDLRSLLSAANVDTATLANYLSIVDQGGDALLQFDPTGHGDGGTIVALGGLGNVVSGLDTLVALGAIRTE